MIDERISRSLLSAHADWEPVAPERLPDAHQPRTAALVAGGISAVAVAGVVTGLSLTSSPRSHPSVVTPVHAAQATTTGVPECGHDDLRLDVSTSKASYVQHDSQSGDMVSILASLVPTGSGACRSFGADEHMQLVGPEGRIVPLVYSCGVTPLPAWCSAAEHGSASPASPVGPSPVVPSPSAPAPNHGLLLAAGGQPLEGGAQETLAAEAVAGQVTPEPEFNARPVGGVDYGGHLDPGQWRVEVIVGQWSGSSTFTVTP